MVILMNESSMYQTVLLTLCFFGGHQEMIYRCSFTTFRGLVDMFVRKMECSRCGGKICIEPRTISSSPQEYFKMKVLRYFPYAGTHRLVYRNAHRK